MSSGVLHITFESSCYKLDLFIDNRKEPTSEQNVNPEILKLSHITYKFTCDELHEILPCTLGSHWIKVCSKK